ncbi:MAG: tail fiber domain-containing protein [Ferruginibacter sp.]
MTKFLFVPLLLPCLNLFSQNTGIGVVAPTNTLHVAAAADPLRLQGLQSGASTDSFITVNSIGVIKQRSITLGGTGWTITGNAGTSSTNNFIGTLDNTPLSFRTNNQRSGFIDPDASRRNNSFGNRALNTALTGTANNAFGYLALSKITSGFDNIALGDSTAFNLTTGSANIAIGTDALASIVTATGNVAVGNNALKNTVSSENTAIGNLAATNNTTGSNVLAIGAGALLNNQSSFTQLAVGNNALQQITGGIENVAMGYNAGTSLTAASYNVLLGHYAFSSATTASNNTVVGHNAGLAYTALGNTNNTFIGYQAGLSQTAGTGNTLVGTAVDLSGTSSVNNSTGLGQGVQITASNQVRVGNTAVSSIGGQVGWTTFSDGNIKSNIREDIPGLAFIMRLRPVTYNYDLVKLQKLQGTKPNAMNRIDPRASAVRFSGLVAQEVEQAAGDVQYDFSGIDKPANPNTPYGLRYAEFVVPLIKAMQEMKLLIDQQQKEIEQLRNMIGSGSINKAANQVKPVQ